MITLNVHRVWTSDFKLPESYAFEDLKALLSMPDFECFLSALKIKNFKIVISYNTTGTEYALYGDSFLVGYLDQEIPGVSSDIPSRWR